MKKKLGFIVIVLMALCAIVAPAFGVTHTNTAVADAADVFPGLQNGKTFVLEGTVDLAAMYSAGTTNAAGDKVAVIRVPSGAYVMAVSAKVVTAPVLPSAAATNAHSAATTFDVGDDGSATNWIVAASNTNAITTVSTPVLSADTNTGVITSAPVSALGKLYSSAQNINVRWTAAPGNLGVVRVRALAIKFD